MAGTDHTNLNVTGGPAVILVEPQMGENIGAAARAMYNFGLTDLRLVRPREGWPNGRAVAMASGATPVIDAARVFASTEEAVADLSWVGATTARLRDMSKTVMDASRAAIAMREHEPEGRGVGIMFGPERSGLDNDDVARANVLITFPVNPAFASLNLGQAVLLVGYEWFKATAADGWQPRERPQIAKRKELDALFAHLESELDLARFLEPPEKRPSMVRNIRDMLLRADLSEQEVRTWRGIVKALSEFRPGRQLPK